MKPLRIGGFLVGAMLNGLICTDYATAAIAKYGSSTRTQITNNG